MNSNNQGDIGQTTTAATGGVGDIISQVEQKMTDLMAWHKAQSVVLDAKRTAQEKETAQQQSELENAKRAIADDREALSRKVEQFELDRQTLKNSAQALQQEQVAVAEAWKQVSSIRKTSATLFEQIDAQRKTLEVRTCSVIDKAQGKTQGKTPEPSSDKPVIVVKQGPRSKHKQNRKANAQR